jgi:hypothetical protein
MPHTLEDGALCVLANVLSQDPKIISNAAGFPVPEKPFPVMSNIFPVMDLTGKSKISI